MEKIGKSVKLNTSYFLKKVAITGSLGSGKSTLLSLFQELGAYVVNADQIVHKLLSLPINAAYIQQVVKLLGEQVIVNGTIDRKRVADIVFQNPFLRNELERITHPLLEDAIKKEYEKVKKEKANSENKYLLFVAEVPLLFEASDKGFDLDWYDKTVCILCDETKAKERYRDQGEYTRRQQVQMSPQEKAKRADFTIINNGTKEDLKKSAKALFQQLIKIP